MSYVLIIIFAAVTGPVDRIDHIDSIRFDNKAACETAQTFIAFNNPKKLDPTTGGFIPATNNVRMQCYPASS